ncbi:MAG: hypothetical protein K6L73_02095 [Cellvibrionaceae bacterium]
MFKKLRRKKQAKQQRTQLIQMHSLLLSQEYLRLALSSIAQGIESNKEHRIIVSLTTIKPRINDIHLTIESIFQQSLKADKVVLWLSEDDFGEHDIPEILKKQIQRGLEIEFCKDIGPHTKYHYTIQKYPNDLVLTVDDDILYPVDTVDMLYREYLKAPNMIHCHRAHRIDLDKNGAIKPYKQWPWNIQDDTPSLTVFPTGVGGVLYFPGCFDDEIINEEAFLKLSPGADDVWLKAMSLKKGTLCKKTTDHRDWGVRFPVISGSQTVSLKRRNKKAGSGNDSKIEATFKAYKLSKKLQDQ